MFKFNLKEKLKDDVTGFKGMAIARMEYLNGCKRYCLQPTELAKDGNPKKEQWIDEQQISSLEKKPKLKSKTKKTTGGPGLEPSKLKEPSV